MLQGFLNLSFLQVATQNFTKSATASPSHIPAPQPSVDPEEALRLSPEQLAKLRSELDIVQENMTILNEMLSELTPGKEHPSDLELLVVSIRGNVAPFIHIVVLIDVLFFFSNFTIRVKRCKND